MIDYQLTPGTKIRCLIDESFLTKNKIYEVISIDYKDSTPMYDLEFWFIDDDGDKMYSSPEHEEFEVV